MKRRVRKFVVCSWWFVVRYSKIYYLWQLFKSSRIWKFGRWQEHYVKKFILYADPIAKDFRYKDQLRGSCGSIMDNIAEGLERGSKPEFINSLTIAKGETREPKSQLYRGLDNNYFSQQLLHQPFSSPNRLDALERFFRISGVSRPILCGGKAGRSL